MPANMTKPVAIIKEIIIMHSTLQDFECAKVGQLRTEQFICREQRVKNALGDRMVATFPESQGT
jgi:hypothetical protein